MWFYFSSTCLVCSSETSWSELRWKQREQTAVCLNPRSHRALISVLRMDDVCHLVFSMFYSPITDFSCRHWMIFTPQLLFLENFRLHLWFPSYRQCPLSKSFCPLLHNELKYRSSHRSVDSINAQVDGAIIFLSPSMQGVDPPIMTETGETMKMEL